MAFKVPEKYRIRTGLFGSTNEHGNNGHFNITSLKLKRILKVVASDGDGWEHVSVSLHDRCPTWDEMSTVRNMFWGPDDLVVQLHPTHDQYVNNHEYTLHLWRKKDTNNFVEMPPKYMV